MFALKAAHSSGGNAKRQRSIPLVTTIPPSKYGRSREGRVKRPFSSSVCSYSPRRARASSSHYAPLRPTTAEILAYKGKMRNLYRCKHRLKGKFHRFWPVYPSLLGARTPLGNIRAHTGWGALCWGSASFESARCCGERL